jgi:hypothetical protein
VHHHDASAQALKFNQVESAQLIMVALSLGLRLPIPYESMLDLPTYSLMSPTTPYVQSGEPLNDFLRSFWQRQVDAAEQETPDYRHPPLPLARIKKVMKSDPDVKVCRSVIKQHRVLTDYVHR